MKLLVIQSHCVRDNQMKLLVVQSNWVDNYGALRKYLLSIALKWTNILYWFKLDSDSLHALSGCNKNIYLQADNNATI